MLCQLPEILAGRDVMEVAREVVATITDPSAMVGPEVQLQ
jgi:hypothetical protein